MGGYVRIDKDLESDPRVLELADLLASIICEDANPTGHMDALCNACRNALLGSLVTLWSYADTHIRSDNTLQIRLKHLAEVMRLPERVLEKFPPEWLVVRDSTTVELPGYCEKNTVVSKEKRREQTRDRVRKWRAARNGGGNESGNAPVTLKNVTVTHSPLPNPEPLPEPNNKKTPSESLVAPTRDDGPVLAVFAHWQREWQHPTSKLDPKRRKRIEARLKDFTAEQLCDAISGFKHSPWHTGTDPKGNGTVYDSLDTLLRDTAQVETGLRLFTHPPRPPPKPETALDRMNRMLNGTDDSRVIDHDPEFPALPSR